MYFAAIATLMLILPLGTMAVEWGLQGGGLAALALKWFVFWGAGARLFTAGLKQITQPLFTSRDILGVADPEAAVLVRELGFANASIGALGLLSLPFPSFLVPAAVTAGVFLALAGVQHAARGGGNAKEQIATVSDLAMAALLGVLVAARVL
ncbi:hypothetical protein [Xanthobacter sp. KR7-225]|uniref:hypothetical protein n=1 Tax=Xanthobacter sp. KR7-225 TaxID=3156613 RepID=UPI0032B42AFC